MGNISNSEVNICKNAIDGNNESEGGKWKPVLCLVSSSVLHQTSDFQEGTTGDSNLENAEVNVSWKYS